MLSPEGAMVVRVSASTVAQPTTTETISTSPDSSVASLAALRGKRLRKYSETDASTERLSSSIKSDGGSSQLYTKVPLTPLAVEDNVDYNFKRQASVRIKKMTSASYHDGSSLFPKLNDCAHFHYDHVELGSVQISMHEESEDRTTLVEQNGGATDLLDCPFTLRMLSQGKVWLLKRCYEDFRVLDKQLHKCIYDRRFSQLVELPKGETLTGREAVRAMLTHYVTRFSQIAGDMINCGPVLNWLELDNHGNHVVASEESAINIPAVAAAHVIKRYAAQAPDEISLEVGDMISVIDMPPPEDTSWWRGKNKFDVGFFPRQCVEIISEKLPLAVAERVPKGPKPEVMSLEASGTWSQSGVTNTQTSMLRKHGKLITFLRSFILERPTRRRLKQSGILKERVFGCDLGEHLLNTGTDVPNIVQDCCQFIEQYGICDGIYRLSGVASNVQYLRDQFDSETTPNLDEYKKDIHCVSSVCKLYFRELPNPLLTYQLYQKFEEAAMSGEENRLMKMHDTVQQLPPPHYRTLQFLIRHLSYMSSFSGETSMNIKNLAIVWAPNLLRSKDIETGSCAAFMEIKVQATVVEYLVKHCDLIFNDKLFPDVPGVGHEMQRPKSLVLSTPTKLLSLEEARARSSSQGNEGGEKDEKPKFIEVGGGPAALPKQYHTVIDLPPESRKRFSASKSKKSPGWRAFFSRSTGKEVKRKMSHDPASLRVPNSKHFGARGHRASLRSVKSAESLSSAESASELQGQDKYSNIHDPARFKGHLRRSSVACMENTLRRSSSDSFFEVDADIVAAATREMLAAQRGEDTYSRDEIFIEEESGATCQLGRRRGSGANSPLWIDQSVSSMESDRASVRSPYAHQPSFQIGRQMSAENNWHIDDVQMSCSANVQYEETPPPSPTGVSSPERYQCTIAEPVAVPQRHPLKTSIAMPVAAAFTPEYRDVEMTESGGSATSPDHSGSVLDKISRAMSIKSKAKLKRESSTEADDYSSLGRSPDTGVDDVMDRPIMVTVRTQTSPHDTLDEMDTGEEVRKYDVNLQTSGSDGAVFMRTPAQRRSMNLDLFSGLDEALLGTTAPRPKSIHVSSHLSRGSESYDDDFGSFTTRLSLDNVLSEYDHILAKYNNRPLTPDFDRSDEMCKYDGMYSGQRISSPRHGITPVTALNSNCNNTRQRRLQHRYSMGDETRAEHFNNRYSSVIMDNGETRKRLSAGAVLDHHTPAQDNDEEVVVVRLRRPRPSSTQKKLYASPERFSINSPEFQASLADQQNGNTPPESATDLRTLKKDDGQCHASSVDAVYHMTLPTRPSSQRRGISKSFSLDFQSSIPDANTRIGEGFVGEGTDNTVNEAEAERAATTHEGDVSLDNLEDDQMPEREDSSSFAFNASVHPSTDQSPIIDRYPLIISDELEL